MFQPPTTNPEQMPEFHRRQQEEEDEMPPMLQQQHSYYAQPQQFQKHDEFLDGISKQTLILVFAAFFIGILLGKSMTPVVLRQ